ncbi:MAG: tetratricopeptide repeat protein [Nitrospirae bacterium]|nr:tetratricopeptide repeat protein [Nitrospirota bacterium]
MLISRLIPVILFCVVLPAAAWPDEQKDFRHFHRTGDWKKTLQFYSPPPDGKDSSEDLMRLAEANYFLNRLDAAEAAAKKALSISGSAEANMLLALIRAKRGAREEALKELSAQAERGVPGALTAMGLIWNRINPKTALALFQRAVEKNDDDFWAWFQIGLIYEEEENFEKAIRAYKHAVRINPYSAQAHNNLGYGYKEMGFYLYAINEYQKALNLMPDNPGFYYNIGNALTHEERIEEAFQAYRRAVELAPTFAKAHYNLGRTFLRKDMVKEAIGELKLYIKHGNTAVFDYVSPKDVVEEEIEDLEKYLRDNPDEKPAQRKLAR